MYQNTLQNTTPPKFKFKIKTQYFKNINNSFKSIFKKKLLAFLALMWFLKLTTLYTTSFLFALSTPTIRPKQISKCDSKIVNLYNTI